MTIRTLEAIIDIPEDRRLVVQLPADIPVGRHRVVTMLDLASSSGDVAAIEPSAFPAIESAQWPHDMPLTRLEMYDDDGR